ncbi:MULTISPECIES: class I SAM-dependent methyltransferase [unclassified Streptomyces]|uniref:class I SAM-dependent methyltransferase n=1 Tax=unclassified Streptomyces TaxID=2593676 RepID=UPI0022511DFF|nr:MULTISPECIES: class I SAM-dependent methyltransferase [unclassified Streptomyces]MCX5330279.1 class I SAM-dependent methyltransferase [Streptomyces sp. NBC_00140]MCX5359678.1 class I SAM-dependent methyltransferase [Streptomyces sp. NBC_00124]
MSVTSRYRDAWESFWSEAPDGQGAVFWDAEPALTAGLHLALFEPHVTAPALPMVDLGCGNGTQTRFLADRFRHVLGVDLSEAAVDRARDADPAGQATYRVLDAVEKGGAESLHAELGDANVYMRGVLHQCEAADRQPLVDGLAALLGEHGRGFLVELSEAAKPILMGLAQHPSGPPPKLAPIFRHGIAPGEVSDDAVPQYLATAGLTVLASGELPLVTTEYTPDGTRIELPSKWLVVGRTA